MEKTVSRYRLQVQRSAIHKRGVFALEAIPRNRRVIEYTGARLRYGEVVRRQRRLMRMGKPPHVYFAWLGQGWAIDGAAGGNGAQFINHCCDPNLDVRRIRGHILFFSKRRIRSGDELTIDYKYDKAERATRCRCGSPKCRGTINLK